VQERIGEAYFFPEIRGLAQERFERDVRVATP
jgi:hypothetical protein